MILFTTTQTSLRAYKMPEQTGDSGYLSDLSPKDKPWDIHRSIADTVQSLYRSAKADRYADRIETCGKQLEYSLNSNEAGDVAFKLQSAKFCRVRHCPVCQWRRSLKWQAKMFEAIPKISEKYKGHRWIFVTLTVRNCDLVDLRATLAHMNTAFGRLTKLTRFPGVGWIKSVEITRNSETGQAHPHIHCLMLVGGGYFGGKSYIKHDEWRSLWQRCLRCEYQPVVNIQTVKPKKNKSTGESDDIGKAIVETFKYSVKESDLVADESWLVELTCQLHQTRAIAIGGVLKSFLKEEKEDDDLIHVDESEPIIEKDEGIKLFFGWREAVKRYRQEDRQ
jgi:plasmid rolling circle replication initiator protein Rep